MRQYLLILIAMLGIGCADVSSQNSGIDKTISLSNGGYKFVSVMIDNISLDIPKDASFNVENDRIFGNTGCNNYFTGLKINDNGSISTSLAGSTRMMCHEDVVNQFEYQYLKNLEGTFSVLQNGENIVLESPSMKIILNKIN